MTANKLLTLMALLVLAAMPAEAQRVVMGAGRAELRLATQVSVPEFRHLKVAAAPVATWQAETYTEYQVRYTVAANTHWAVVAAELPAGVILLDEHGQFTGEDNTVALRGERTNPTEVLLRLRVTATAPRDWAEDLRLELRAGR